MKCVFERDWKRNSFPKPTLRRFGGRKRVANVVVARHGPKVRRSLSLSLCVCVCVFLSSLCVRDRYLLVARGGRVILFLYLRLEKKRVRRKPKKRADWLGKNLHMRIARAPLVRFVLYHKHQTTDHLKRVLSLPSFATDNNQGSRSRVTRRSQQAGQSTTPRENKTR